MKNARKAHQETGARPKKKRTGSAKVTNGTTKAPKLGIVPGMVYTVPQVAAILQVSDDTVREMLKRKELTGRKIGQSWRVLGETLQGFMREFRPLVKAAGICGDCVKDPCDDRQDGTIACNDFKKGGE